MKRISVKEKRITTMSGGLAQLFILAKKYPVLSREEEKTATEEQLINHNLLFVISVAKRYEHHGAELLDLIQEGRIGLMKAAKAFDSSLGYKFTSYAVNKIRSEITRYIASKRDLIRLPDKINTFTYKIDQSKGQDETIEQTAQRIGLSKNDYKNIINIKKIVSFDDVDREGETYIEVAGDFFADSLILKNDIGNVIKRAIKKLPEREQTIIKMRFYSDTGNTLEDVSKILQLTRERVRQLELQALKKLKLHLQTESR